MVGRISAFRGEESGNQGFPGEDSMLSWQGIRAFVERDSGFHGDSGFRLKRKLKKTSDWTRLGSRAATLIKGVGLGATLHWRILKP